MPVPALYSIVTDMRAHLSSKGYYMPDGSGVVTNVVGFGHVGIFVDLFPDESFC